MSVLEIVATVVLCLIGVCVVLLWGQVTLLSYRRNGDKTPPTKEEELAKISAASEKVLKERFFDGEVVLSSTLRRASEELASELYSEGFRKIY